MTQKSEQGLTGTTSTVISDIESILKTLIPSRPTQNAPVFLMGHSMGGQELLTFGAIGSPDLKSQIRGYLCEAPFIGFDPASAPPALKVTLGRLASRLMPHFQLKNQLDPTLVSRDPEVQKSYVEDELCHDTGTLEGLAAMLDRVADLQNGKLKFPADAGEGGKVRMWISHGTSDKVCSFDVTKKYYEGLDKGIEDKELKAYDGWYHQREYTAVFYRVFKLLTRVQYIVIRLEKIE